jgi:hypothetical protein
MTRALEFAGKSAAIARWAAVVAAAGVLCGQQLMTGSAGQISLVGPDLAVLEAREVRQDLPCQAVPVKAQLGFDLRFHAGYDVSVPLKELAGAENLLTIIVRVTPEATPDSPVYLIQKIKVPSIEADAKGDAYLQGSFDLGEGKYKVEWLMRDRSERVCAHNWDLEAVLSQRDKQLTVELTPSTVAASLAEQFGEEPVISRGAPETPLNIKLVVNFAPQSSTASTLQPLDTAALVSILRCVARDPRVTRFSLVAFNMQEQKVIFRQDAADHIDFPAIGEALRGLQLGKVDLTQLANKNSDSEFLSRLLREEVAAPPGGGGPDAVIIAGPKVMLDQNPETETLRNPEENAAPVFYMNYNLNPQQTPWRDAISHAVRSMRGTEYTISRPRDLWFAVAETLGRVVKLKSGKKPGGPASN